MASHIEHAEVIQNHLGTSDGVIQACPGRRLRRRARARNLAGRLGAAQIETILAAGDNGEGGCTPFSLTPATGKPPPPLELRSPRRRKLAF